VYSLPPPYCRNFGSPDASHFRGTCFAWLAPLHCAFSPPWSDRDRRIAFGIVSELTGLGFAPVPPGWACASPGSLTPGTKGLANLSSVRTTKIALREPARRSARTPLPKTSKHASSW